MDVNQGQLDVLKVMITLIKMSGSVGCWLVSGHQTETGDQALTGLKQLRSVSGNGGSGFSMCRDLRVPAIDQREFGFVLCC